MLENENHLGSLLDQMRKFKYEDLNFSSLLDELCNDKNEEIQEKAMSLVELYFGIDEGLIYENEELQFLNLNGNNFEFKI